VTDPRLDKLADVLVDYSLALTREDRFILRGDELAAPLLREVYRRAARRGTHTLVQWTMSGLEEIFLKETPEDRFGEPSYWAAREMEAATCILSVGAPSNTRALAHPAGPPGAGAEGESPRTGDLPAPLAGGGAALVLHRLPLPGGRAGSRHVPRGVGGVHFPRRAAGPA
jgi:hypothetical protein